MDTKAKGDISEQGVVFQLLKLGWNVLRPIGDRLPYDIVIERNNKFIKIQVKTSYYLEKQKAHCINVRMTKTNRKEYKYVHYTKSDFDFAICFIPETDNYYVYPIDFFISYKNSIRLTKTTTHSEYKNNWMLLEKYIAD